MYTLTLSETHLISGGATSDDSENNYHNYPLRVYLKRDALYGALGLGLLLAPGGWSLSLFGSALGATLGVGYGYVEWLIYK